MAWRRALLSRNRRTGGLHPSAYPIQPCARLVGVLIDIEFRLGAIFLPRVNIILPEAVMCVGQIRIQLESSLILWYGRRIFMLVGVEVAQLHVGLGKRRVQCD